MHHERTKKNIYMDQTLSVLHWQYLWQEYSIDLHKMLLGPLPEDQNAMQQRDGLSYVHISTHPVLNKQQLIIFYSSRSRSGRFRESGVTRNVLEKCTQVVCETTPCMT